MSGPGAAAARHAASRAARHAKDAARAAYAAAYAAGEEEEEKPSHRPHDAEPILAKDGRGGGGGACNGVGCSLHVAEDGRSYVPTAPIPNLDPNLDPDLDPDPNMVEDSRSYAPTCVAASREPDVLSLTLTLPPSRIQGVEPRGDPP